MKTIGAFAVLVLLAAAAIGGDKPKRILDYAASWDEAVAEARALNLPIVVHRHGFY
ncbi:MAG: hypothetical protein ACYTGV_03450 [Planctomycetota bacterium]|jgi:hypothetical protein